MAAAPGWAPKPANGANIWGEEQEPPSKRARKDGQIDNAAATESSVEVGHSEEALLTMMLGSMLDMLRDLPPFKRWAAYEKFREIATELKEEPKEDAPGTSGT